VSLVNTQAAIITAFFNPSTLSQTTHLIKSDQRLTVEQRLGIYRHSIQGILGQHLRAVYDVVAQLVGAEFFEYLTEVHIDQSPPSSTALSEYGEGFSSTLLNHPALKNMPWIAEVARLEWARSQAWQGVNQAPRSFNDLSNLSEAEYNQVVLQLPDSAQLLESNYAIYDVWLAHQNNECLDKPHLESIDLSQPNSILIYRVGKQLHQYKMNNQQQLNFIKAIQYKSTLEQLADEFNEYLNEVLVLGLQQGWIYNWSLKDQY
jgi:hypothetical protein